MSRLLKDVEYEYNDLSLELSSALKNSDLVALRCALTTVISEMSHGSNLVDLFPDMVKVCGSVDLVCKKLAYLYLSRYASQEPNLALLAVNSLHKDCVDPNPMLRGQALKMLCSMRIEEFLTYIKPSLLQAFQDKSSYVRQIAVTSSLKIHSLNPDFIKANNIIDKIYELFIGDTDGMVVTHALYALQQIQKDQGGLILTKKMVIHLLNKLDTFSDWGKAYVLEVLLNYQPTSEEEVFDIMNLLDKYLALPNSAVSLAVAALMIQLTNHMSDVQKDVLRKLRGILLNYLGNEQPEIVFITLCHLQRLHHMLPKRLSKEYKKFFCRYSEPLYVKCKKVEILQELCCTSNYKEMLTELNTYCLDVSPKLAERAIEAFGSIAKSSKVIGEQCVEMLIKLVTVERVTSSALFCLKDLLDVDVYKKFAPEVIDMLPNLWSTVEDSKGKEAMLWILGQHGRDLDEAPYLLEALIDNVEEEVCVSTKCHLLTANVKLFFSRPAECQDMLGKLLEHCVEGQTNPDLQEKGLLYYKLLHTDLNLAKHILCSEKTQFTTDLSENNHQSSENYFNTLGIVLDSRKWEHLQGSKDLHSNQLPPPKEHQDPETKETTEGQLVDLTGPPQVHPKEDTCKKQEVEALNIDGEKNEATGPALVYDKQFHMTPAEFEEAWTKFSSQKPLEFKTESVHQSLLVSKWEEAGYHTMATTPDESQDWRAFVYCKSQLVTFLFEITITVQGKHICIQTKCDGDDMMKCDAENQLKLLIQEAG